MKILKLELINFEAIKHCMHTDRICIDFSKAKNKICLIIGPNGSGKTTILSLLNPFATLGNLDVRDTYGLICPHKDGKKEIWIQDGSDLYKIQHFYTATKETHSTKSFIQKNDEELNPNGNVTSFKERIKEELHLELDYLKLVRLGPNVKSLIDLSSTERKNFMVNLLDDIGIYTQYYKHVNTNMRTLKEMLSHTMDKIKRCQFDTIEDYEKTLDKIEKEIVNLESQLRVFQDKLAISKNQQIELGSIEFLQDEYRNYSKKLHKLEKAKERIAQDKKSSSYYKEEYHRAENDVTRYDTMIETTKILLEREISLRDELETRERKLEIQVSQELHISDELDRMNTLLDDMNTRIREREELLKSFHTDIDLKEFEEFLSFLKASEITIRKLYDFGQDPIRKIISLLKQKRDVQHFINSGLMDASSDDGQEVFMERIRRIGSFDNEISCETKGSCPAYKIWEYFHKLLIDRNVSEKERKSVEFYHDMELIYDSLMHILNGFKLHTSVITQLPKKLKDPFLMKEVFSRISDGKPLYSEKDMDHFYSLIREEHELILLREERNKLIGEIQKIERFSKNTLLEDDLVETRDKIITTKENISSYRDKIQEYRNLKQESMLTAEAMKDAADACENYEIVRDSTKSLREKIESYSILNRTIQEVDLESRKIENNLIQQRKIKGALETDYKLFIEMRHNILLYKRHYDNMEYTKKALSASKGIPTLIVKHYLQDTENITNELLDIAYDGEVTVEKFDINADTFSIPVYIHGSRRPDVKLASQGEVAFLSVALSFALISQSLGKYNIMSLDEVDGPLDSENRRKFISILENQIERIGSEQNFLITHNDMFSNYPVDIIDLSWDSHTDNKYDLANYITVIRD